MKINLDSVRKEMDKADKVREKIIRQSRTLIKNSKTAIGMIHRDELTSAKNVLDQMTSSLDELKKSVAAVPRFGHEGIFKVAIQEYVEALSLYQFVKHGTLLTYSPEFVDVENYLMGLCDLGGELVRKAINSSLKENYGVSTKIRAFLDALYVELSKFDFRNGELRRKYDGIKYDIKKLDDLVFTLKMKDKI